VSKRKGGGAMQPTIPGYWTASSFLVVRNAIKYDYIKKLKNVNGGLTSYSHKKCIKIKKTRSMPLA
jgi:thioredoxin-related protein